MSNERVTSNLDGLVKTYVVVQSYCDDGYYRCMCLWSIEIIAFIAVHCYDPRPQYKAVS